MTDWFNKRLLKHIYDQHGRETTGKRIETDFDALTGDDEIDREEVKDELRAGGIDADETINDMVSWSTMREHLKECLDGEKITAASETEWERNSVSVAQHVTKTKVNKALRSLDSKGKLPGAADAAVEPQILLSCPECPTRIPFTDALERGFICEDHLGVASVSES